MATSAEEICNSALQKLGAEDITSLSDTTRRAVLCNRQYNKIRLKLLRSHPWNFAIKRAILSRIEMNSTSVNDGTDTFTTTATSEFVSGSRVRLLKNSGTLPAPLQENTDYYVIVLTGTTFQLATSYENAIASTQIDITDSPVFDADFQLAGLFEYEAVYTLPSDYLRGIREESKDVDWKIEENRLVTNESAFNLVYIKDVTDTTEFDESFDELLAAKLAVELSYSMVQSLSLKKDLKEDLSEIMKDVRSFDAQEGQPEELETNQWLVSRQ